MGSLQATFFWAPTTHVSLYQAINQPTEQPKDSLSYLLFHLGFFPRNNYTVHSFFTPCLLVFIVYLQQRLLHLTDMDLFGNQPSSQSTNGLCMTKALLIHSLSIFGSIQRNSSPLTLLCPGGVFSWDLVTSQMFPRVSFALCHKSAAARPSTFPLPGRGDTEIHTHIHSQIEIYTNTRIYFEQMYKYKSVLI